MNEKELVDRFKLKANLDTSIKTFYFDDLPVINTDRNKQYPVVLMKAPTSIITPFQDAANEPLWENYTITLFVLKPWKKADKATTPLETAYRDVSLIGDTYLRDVLQSGANEFSLIDAKQVTKQRGHHQHVDQLIGIQYTFTLRVFNNLC